MRWFQSGAAKRLPLLFAAVTVIPGIALGYLTWALLDRDDRLQAQRAQDRAEQAADRILAVAHQRLIELEAELRRLLASGDSRPPVGTIFVSATEDSVTVVPKGSLLFYPLVTAVNALSSNAFAVGERLEFLDDSPAQAIDWFSARSASSDARIRAGALLRLARNQRKVGRLEDALVTYGQLGKLDGVAVDGLPAAIAALVGRCEIWQERGRTADLASDAATLRDGLIKGHWPVRKEQFDFYFQRVADWSGGTDHAPVDLDAYAASSAFGSLYERWTSTGDVTQRQWVTTEQRPILVATVATGERLSVLLGGSDYFRRAWQDVDAVAVQLTDGEGRSVLGALPTGSVASAVRASDISKLPWTLRVAVTSRAIDEAAIRQRQWLLYGGLAMIVLLLGGSAYFTFRGVSRELAVAQLQSDFVAAVSHEFRTPLASVRHLSDMLSEGRVSSELHRQDCYRHLSQESERLETLVEDLLDFGRFENGAYQYRFEHLDIGPLVRQIVDDFAMTTRNQGRAVHVSLPGSTLDLRVDPEALSRALRNLLENAVKYSPDTDTVSVTVDFVPEGVRISVQDRGFGIPPGELDLIFRKFARGSNVRDRQIKGTGVGLAMVRHIMDAHRGSVRVQSILNEGSTFSLVLPSSAVAGFVPSEADRSGSVGRQPTRPARL